MIYPAPPGITPLTHKCGCGSRLTMPYVAGRTESTLVCAADETHDTYVSKYSRTRLVTGQEVDILTSEVTDTNPVDLATTHQWLDGALQLSASEIKRLFCPKASDAEAQLFFQVCRYQKLNPFLKEAYLIKYQDSEPASIVVGKEAFTKRAQRIDDCRGWAAGILVDRGGVLAEQEGSVLLPGDKLIGGWCRVKRRSVDADFYHTVGLSEYLQTTRTGTVTKFWDKMPATMIRKVAIVQGLRECFPEDFDRLYDAVEVIDGQVIQSTGEVIDDLPNNSTAVIIPQVEESKPDPLPTFGTCPVHEGVPWTTKANNWGGISVWHSLGEGEYCRQAVILKAQFGDAWAHEHYGERVQAEMNLWLKVTYGGKTWSKLSPDEMLDALSKVSKTDRPSAVDGVDQITGEILGEPAEDPGPPDEPPDDDDAEEYAAFLISEAAKQEEEPATPA